MIFLNNLFGSETKAKIVGRVEFNGQHFDIVEYGGGGDCCFRSFANTNEFIDGKSISNFVDLLRLCILLIQWIYQDNHVSRIM